MKNTIETKETKEQPAVEKKKDIVVELPAVPREFRAAWVASVANINWPSKNYLSTAEQQQEAIGILDF
ncbi:family 10 glycosylhydrolase [Sphingobacterium sp. E70]|nr:family 10 glycosylhydrolase [Sphingobacterium sp. E70]ULT28782.1 family 10 glycosylhydrolase [Sphingobacterium sp. E70]